MFPEHRKCHLLKRYDKYKYDSKKKLEQTLLTSEISKLQVVNTTGHFIITTRHKCLPPNLKVFSSRLLDKCRCVKFIG